MEEKEKKRPEIQIELDDATAQGVYANLAMIGHSESEFVLDFIFLQPQNQRAKVRARILSSPSHAKRFLFALQDNVAKYEEQFGEIKLAAPIVEDKKLGFLH